MRHQSSKTDKQKVSVFCTNPNIDNSLYEGSFEDGRLQLANGQSVPVISGSCTLDLTDEGRKLDVRTGYVGEHEVQVLRDTGCELAVVKKKFVWPEQFLPKEYLMIPIDGRHLMVKVADIYVDTPYYRGNIEAMVLETAICDLVLGNVDGVSNLPDRQ